LRCNHIALNFILPVSLLRGGGRWGVAQGCNCRPILDAIALLIKAQRPDFAMALI